MVKTRKHLTVHARHIYHAELERCPHCQEPLQTQRHYQWRKTVQHLANTVYVASHGSCCANPTCSHTGQVYTSAAAQAVTVPRRTYVGCDCPDWLVA